MYYFDNEYLKSYLNTGSKLQVLVNKEYLTITDESDLENTQTGLGYGNHGEPFEYSYQEIQAVKIDDVIYTIEQLNSYMDPKAEPASEKKEEPKDDKKEESYKPGDYIKNINKKSSYYNSTGPIQNILEHNAISYKTLVNEEYRTVICFKHEITKG